MRRIAAWSLLLIGACGARIAPGSEDNGLGTTDAGDGASDASSTPIDAGTADAAPLGKFGPATTISVAATTKGEDDATLSSTGLEMIFAIDNGANGKDLYYTSRASTAAAWSTPQPVPFNDNAKSDETPRFSPDDKTLYFASARGNANGTLDIYSIKRDNVGANVWGTPNKNGTVSTARTEKWYMPCGTQFLMVQDDGNGNIHFVGGAQGTAGVPIPELAAATGAETGTFFTSDCKTLYFASTRTAPTMIYVSTRDTVDSKWKAPTPYTELKITGGNGNEEDPWMSPDGRIFVFVSDAVTANGKDVYMTTR